MSLTCKRSRGGDQEHPERKRKASESWVTHRGSIDAGSSQRYSSDTADGAALQCGTIMPFSISSTCQVACSLTCSALPLVPVLGPSCLVRLSDLSGQAEENVGGGRTIIGINDLQSDGRRK
jgi:hypothetical protein